MIRYFSHLGSGYHVLGSRNDMPVTVIPFPSLGERKIILGNGILVTVNHLWASQISVVFMKAIPRGGRDIRWPIQR